MGYLTDITQHSPEWYAARMGIATASEAARILVRDASKGAATFGKAALEYALEIAAERLGGTDEAFASAAMERGTLLEGDALDAYEERTFREVHRGRFYLCDTMAFGCSPDGVTHDGKRLGTVEVKCMKRSKHAAVWISGKVPDEHYAQVQATMWNVEADFCDFVSYHPGVREDRQLCIVRVDRDAKFLEVFTPRLLRFLSIVEDYSTKLGITQKQ